MTEHMPLPKKEDIMRAIREGRVHMRPRWHFILRGVLAGIGVLIILLTLLYVTSFVMFTLRASGVLFVPLFGVGGVFAFLHALPGLLFMLLVLFVAVLEILVRRFRFGYRAPLWGSVFMILSIMLLGGFVLERTRIHDRIMHHVRAGNVPPSIGMMYRGAMPPPPEVHRGVIITTTTQGFVMFDENGDGTTTVFVDKKTRLPFGAEFTAGETVVVFGPSKKEGVRAFGVEQIDE